MVKHLDAQSARACVGKHGTQRCHWPQTGKDDANAEGSGDTGSDVVPQWVLVAKAADKDMKR